MCFIWLSISMILSSICDGCLLVVIFYAVDFIWSATTSSQSTHHQILLRQVSPYFLVLLKALSLVAFLVEDACVGGFMSLCL
jgi:hypothetical protein